VTNLLLVHVVVDLSGWSSKSGLYGQQKPNNDNVSLSFRSDYYTARTPQLWRAEMAGKGQAAVRGSLRMRTSRGLDQPDSGDVVEVRESRFERT
jgi:hypothetical protein